MEGRKPPFQVQVWHGYQARNAGEVTLLVGQIYTVNEVEARGAWFGTPGPSGRTIWFPASYTKFVDASEPIKAPTQNPGQYGAGGAGGAIGAGAGSSLVAGTGAGSSLVAGSGSVSVSVSGSGLSAGSGSVSGSGPGSSLSPPGDSHHPPLSPHHGSHSPAPPGSTTATPIPRTVSSTQGTPLPSTQDVSNNPPTTPLPAKALFMQSLMKKGQLREDEPKKLIARPLNPASPAPNKVAPNSVAHSAPNTVKYTPEGTSEDVCVSPKTKPASSSGPSTRPHGRDDLTSSDGASQHSEEISSSDSGSAAVLSPKRDSTGPNGSDQSDTPLKKSRRKSMGTKSRITSDKKQQKDTKPDEKDKKKTKDKPKEKEKDKKKKDKEKDKDKKKKQKGKKGDGNASEDESNDVEPTPTYVPAVPPPEDSVPLPASDKTVVSPTEPPQHPPSSGPPPTRPVVPPPASAAHHATPNPQPNSVSPRAPVNIPPPASAPPPPEVARPPRPVVPPTTVTTPPEAVTVPPEIEKPQVAPPEVANPPSEVPKTPSEVTKPSPEVTKAAPEPIKPGEPGKARDMMMFLRANVVGGVKAPTEKNTSTPQRPSVSPPNDSAPPPPDVVPYPPNDAVPPPSNISVPPPPSDAVPPPPNNSVPPPPNDALPPPPTVPPPPKDVLPPPPTVPPPPKDAVPPPKAAIPPPPKDAVPPPKDAVPPPPSDVVLPPPTDAVPPPVRTHSDKKSSHTPPPPTDAAPPPIRTSTDVLLPRSIAPTDSVGPPPRAGSSGVHVVVPPPPIDQVPPPADKVGPPTDYVPPPVRPPNDVVRLPPPMDAIPPPSHVGIRPPPTDVVVPPPPTDIVHPPPTDAVAPPPRDVVPPPPTDIVVGPPPTDIVSPPNDVVPPPTTVIPPPPDTVPPPPPPTDIVVPPTDVINSQPPTDAVSPPSLDSVAVGETGSTNASSPRLTDEEKRREHTTQRRHIIQEIALTEKDYVRDLKFLIEHFKEPLLSKKLITTEQCTQIFSNIDVLAQMNERIAAAVDEDMANLAKQGKTIENLCIGKIFTQLAPFLKMYLSYCNNHDNALMTLSKLKKKKKALEDFDRSMSESPDTKGLYLKDYLIKPIQRLCKYPLLFQNLLKVTPTDEPDFVNIQATLEKIDLIVRDINEIRDNNVNFLACFQYEERLTDYPKSLVSRGRKFIREGALLVTEEKKSKVQSVRRTGAQERIVVVFNDKILFCKKVFSISGKAHDLKFVEELMTDAVRVIDMYKEHPDHETSFMLESHHDSKKTRLLFFEEKKDKTTWWKLLNEAVKAAKVSWIKKETAGVQDVALKSKLRADTITDDQVRALAFALADPETGIKLKTRKQVMRTFKNCFVGKDLVTFMAEQNYVDTREDGVAIGRILLSQNFIMHVTNEHNFKDEVLLYKFSPSLVPDDPRKPRSVSTIQKSSPAGSPNPGLLRNPSQQKEGASPRTGGNSSQVNGDDSGDVDSPDVSGESVMINTVESSAMMTSNSTSEVPSVADSKPEDTSTAANDGSESGEH